MNTQTIGINTASIKSANLKTITLAALFSVTALVTSGVSAKDIHFDTDCDIDLDAGMRITNNSIEFLDKDEKSLYKIINDDTLMINGQKQTLNSSQHVLIHQYSTSIRAVVPQVRTVAMDGLQLASEGVALAFNELLGEGNEVTENLSKEFTSLQHELSTRLSADSELYISADGNISNSSTSDGNRDEFFDEDFEQHIESIVEKTMMNSMGSLMVAVGQQMLLSGGNTNTFETKMEAFGEKIEQEIEHRAKQIEVKANDICLSVVNIDQLEEKLKASIPALSHIDVLEASFQKHDNHDKA